MAHRKTFDYADVFDYMVYPAGEPHVRLKKEMQHELRQLDPYFRPFIITNASDWNGVMAVAIADEVLKQSGIEATFVIPYFPFARHDRRNDVYDSSPVPWVLQLLKDVDAITIDPHSDVAGVLPHFGQREVVLAFAEAGIFVQDPVVVIPDAGAAKKAYSWIPKNTDYVQALKTRDVTTGKLSGFQVIDSEKVAGRNCVIIDDICDGGGTFLGLADVLKDAGAESLILGVTHGLFTKGIDVILEKFLWVYTMDTSKVPNGGAVMAVSTHKIVLEGNYF